MKPETVVNGILQTVEIGAVVEAIKPLLAGRDPAVQSAVLADLLSYRLAGHPPFVRQGLLDRHLCLVARLIECNEKELFGNAGHPQKEPM